MDVAVNSSGKAPLGRRPVMRMSLSMIVAGKVAELGKGLVSDQSS